MSMLAADPAAVAGPLEITSLLADTANVLASLLRADWAGTIEIIEDRASLRQTTWNLTATEGRSAPDVQMASRLPGCSMAGWALETGRSVVTANLPGDRRFVDGVLKDLGIQSGLCVPILFLGVPIGALGVYRNEDRPFSAADVATAEKIVQPLAALWRRFAASRRCGRIVTRAPRTPTSRWPTSDGVRGGSSPAGNGSPRSLARTCRAQLTFARSSAAISRSAGSPSTWPIHRPSRT